MPHLAAKKARKVSICLFSLPIAALRTTSKRTGLKHQQPQLYLKILWVDRAQLDSPAPGGI